MIILKNSFDKKMRELISATTIAFAISFITHFPGLNGYTDIIYLYYRDVLGKEHPPPFNYTILPGLVQLICSLVPGAKQSDQIYASAMAFMLYLFAIGTVLIIYKLCILMEKDFYRIYLFLIFTPSFIFFSYYDFELIEIFFLFLSIYMFIKKRIKASALSLGLAIAAKLIPIIYIPAFLSKINGWRERGRFLILTVLGWLIPNIYFIISNWDGWSFIYRSQLEWGIEDSWLIYLFPQMSPMSKYISAVLFTYVMIKVLTKIPQHGLLEKCWALTLGFVFTNFKVPPQYALLLLPYFVLIPKIPLQAFYIPELLNWLIIVFWFNPQFNFGNPLSPYSPVQAISALRQFIWFIFFIWILYPEKLFNLWIYLKKPINEGAKQNST
jgi:uncharacterized membrane protein